MYAMKYMNKAQCLQKEAIKNVVREMSILRHLEHPFLVNLWYSFEGKSTVFSDNIYTVRAHVSIQTHPHTEQ